MATTGNLDGRLLRIKIDGNTVACAKECTLNMERDLLDSSCKDGAGNKSHISGLFGWSIDVSALVDFSATVGVTDLGTAIINGTQLTAVFETGVSGDTSWTGTVDLSSLSITSANGAIVEYSGTMQGTGALTQAITS